LIHFLFIVDGGIEMAKSEYGDVIGPLHFFGEQQKPDSPEKTLDRRFVLGDGRIPAELERMKSRLSIYLHSDNSDQKPEVEVDRVEEAEKGTTWRVEMASRDKENMIQRGLMGRRASREKPEFFLRDINPSVPFTSFRPSWIDATFSPRIITQRERFSSMRRINGRPVRPLYVFNPDDRWSFRDPAWPWGLVGKVFTSSGWTGSAALIGDRLIATAGHVVPWNDGSWWMRFVPAYFDGVSLHGSGVESYVSDVRGMDVDGDVTGYDWAVCRLYEPLGASLGYFGYNGYKSDWENDPYWSIIGYPDAIMGGRRPSFQGSISSFDTDGDSNGGLEIETRGDLTAGNSGGPMFGWWNGDPRLIGVVSGEEEDWSPGVFPRQWGDTERGNVIAGGSGFTNLMAWGRTNWPF